MARRRCPVCGSKQWRKEPSSGLITCGEGHVLQNYRNETSQLDEITPHALRKRTLKSGRKKREWQSKADPKLYHGERGRYHYYQCLQVLLRMQIKALIDVWDLPPEFEVVCRDVWALHLVLLPNPPPAEPYLYALDQRGGADAPFDRPSSNGAAESDKEADDQGADDRSGPPSSSSSSEDEDDEDSEMERLLRENSFASSSEDEDDQKMPVVHRPAKGKKRRKTHVHSGYDAPAGNLAVLMVACWTLRIPMMYMDFVTLVESYDLPYLDPIRLLPQSLTLHLTKQTVQALSPHFPPSTMVFHRLTTRLARLMYQTHSVFTPECNAPPLLWRAVHHLHGTPTLYILSKKLARVLSITLTLHHSLSPTLKRIKRRDPEHHKYDNAPVEVMLGALVIIVLKLVYGFDGKKRTPTSRDDPACTMPNLTEYIFAIRRLDEQDMSVEKRLLSTSSDAPPALDLDEGMIDDYLSFCEKALLPPLTSDNRKDENTVLRDFFPLRAAQGASVTQRGPTEATPSAEAMSAVHLREDSTDLRPGQSYKIYNTRDILGSLPEEHELVVRRVSKWAGVEDEYVYGVVEKFERRLARWWDRVRRSERAGDVGENDKQDSSDDGISDEP